MKIRSKKSSWFIILFVVLSVVIVCCGTYKRSKEIPIQYVHSSYLFDPTDLQLRIGASEYVFVATVKDLETEYHRGGLPYTRYTLQVISNIKGELVTEQPISVLKVGGLAEDGSAYYVLSDDFLPENGCSYIFIANAQSDGSLLLSGPCSNLELTFSSVMNNDLSTISSESTEPVLKNSPEYEQVCEAFRNEVTTYNESQYVSIYDAKE